MKKQLVLICLLATSIYSLYGQTIYYTETSLNRISRGGLGASSITTPTVHVSGLANLGPLVVAQGTSKLYYLMDGGQTLIRATLSTGAQESVVITEGAMAELYDICYYPDDIGLYAANGPEVGGVKFIPANNNDGGTDTPVNLGIYDNDVITAVEVNNDAGVLYFIDFDVAQVVGMPIGSTSPDFVFTLTDPQFIAVDETYGYLYVVDYVSPTYYLRRIDLSTNAISGNLANLGTATINDMNIYPGYNKVYFSRTGTGIYSVPAAGGTVSQELSLSGAGNIYFDIQADLTPPVFITLNPTDNATNVASNIFSMTFDSNIQKSTTAGTATETGIRLMRASDNAQIEILDRSSAAVTVSGTGATFTFTTSMEGSTDYYILIGNKVFSDASSNNFIGISLTTGWNFTTAPGVILNSPSGVACVGTYKSYPAMTITEASTGDFPVGTSRTLTFTFSSAGYLFENTTGTIAASGGDLTINSFGIGPSTISINYTVTGTANIDVITISGMRINSSVETNPTTTIWRAGGTGVVLGLPLNTVIGTVPTQAQPPAPTITLNEGANICVGDDPSTHTYTAGGTYLRWFTANNLLPASFITPLNDQVTVSAQDLGISTATAGAVSRYVRQNVGGCISLATPIDLTINDPPANILSTNSAQTFCAPPNGSATVTSVDGGSPSNYTFNWMDQDMNALGVATPSITGLAAGTYNVTATSNATGCESASTSVVIGSSIVLPTVTLNSADNTHCTTPNGSLTATITNQVGQITDYTFTWYNGPTTASPVNPSSTGPTLSGISAGTYTVKVVRNATQCEAVTTGAVIDNPVPPVPVAPSGDVCEDTPGAGTATVTLTTFNSTITGGNADLTVTWKDPGNNVVTSAVVADNDTYTYEVRSLSTDCMTSANLIFNVEAAPTAADAGPDMETCGTTAILAANTPIVGTGAWSIQVGLGGSIASPSSSTSSFDGVTGETYLLRWTITGAASCPVSTDEVTVTFSPPTTVPAAGTDQSICSTTTTLNANAPMFGTGSWSVVTGAGGSFTNASSPTSDFTGTAGTTYTLRWTISSACGDLSDDVQIAIASPPTAANAGTDQITCSTINLAANTPVVGTGTWSIVSGTGGSFGNTASPTSTFSGTPGQVYTLRWTISNNPCAPSSDNVIITFSGSPTTANAGADKSSCGTTVAMTANSPSVGTGAWSIVSGTGGSFTDGASPTTNFTGTVGTNYTLRWTISNGSCTPSTDEVAVTLVESPTVAAAGPDQVLCGNSTTMAANAPTIGTGSWSVVSGAGGSFVTATSPTSTFNGTAGVTYTLRWTTSNTPCSTSTDDVVVTFTTGPTIANAGADKNSCGATVAMTGNTPVSGTGAWSVVSGTGGSFTDAASPTTTFTGNIGSTYTLRWTITSGSCTPSTDDLIVTLVQSPTVANAGADQVLCGNTATLAANAPTVGTGLWSVVSGAGGTFGSATSPTSTFTGTAGVTYTLRWTVSNLPCTASTDDVVITFNSAPTTANAGTDKNFCGTTVAMTANTPVAGTGAWSVVTGTGGSFANSASASSSFTGTAGLTYTLRWTISNGACAASTDDVVVTLVSPPTPSVAGADQTICNTSTTLAGNTPAIGTGSWSVVTGAGGTISDPASPTSSFTGTADVAYTLRWTTSNGICNPSTDDVVIRLTDPITTAQAGADQDFCGTALNLAGNVPSSGTGTWTMISGAGGIITTPANATSNFSGVVGNTYVLRWTISKTGCGASTDEVSITFRTVPTGNGVITPNDDLCAGTASTLSVTGFTNATSFQWTVPPGISAPAETGASLEITAQSGNGGTITVTPRNDCGPGTPASVNIAVLPSPSVEIVLPAPAFPEEVVTFTFNTDQPLQSSEWSLGGSLLSGQSVDHVFGTAGDYEISLTLTSEQGCISTDSKTYTVAGEPDLTDFAIKNVITANGDDKNRILYIENLERYPENEVRFVDRWGTEIFSASNYQNNWEAKGKDGQFLPAGQYICIVKLSSTGKVISRTVSILKGL